MQLQSRRAIGLSRHGVKQCRRTSLSWISRAFHPRDLWRVRAALAVRRAPLDGVIQWLRGGGWVGGVVGAAYHSLPEAFHLQSNAARDTSGGANIVCLLLYGKREPPVWLGCTGQERPTGPPSWIARELPTRDFLQVCSIGFSGHDESRFASEQLAATGSRFWR